MTTPTSPDERTRALTEAYWKIREHASSYASLPAVRGARARWEASGRTDEEVGRRVRADRNYVRGIDAAADDIAAMLGMSEDEIEQPTRTSGDPQC